MVLFVLAFDLAILALLVGIEQGISQAGLSQLMLINPTDIFRLLNLSGLDSSDVNGVLAVAMNASLSQTQLFTALVAWVVLPLSLATLLFYRKKL